MNELIISQILSFFYGIASGLWTDAILTSQKQKLLAQLRQQEQSQAAFDAMRPPLPAKLSALSDRSTRGLTMSDAIALRPRAAG